LIQDISNSEIVGSTSSASGTPSNLSASAISDLSSAFTKLIGDLGGSTSSTSAAASGSSTSGSSSTQTGTAALQSFLTSFLQDLQNNGNTSTSNQGNLINTLA
jgi:hypothetical protein